MKSIDRNISYIYYNTTLNLKIHPAETDRLLKFLISWNGPARTGP